MVTKIKNIIEGHAKLIKNEDSILADLATKRLRHCKSCVLFNGVSCDKSIVAEHVNTGNVTSGCGCTMKAKVLVYTVDCPLGKWASKTKPIQLLKESSTWNQVRSNIYSDGVNSLELIDHTWLFTNDNSTTITIRTYDEFLKLLEND